VYRTKFYPDAPPDDLDDAVRSALSVKEALEQGVLANFYQMPDSTASNLVFETLGAGKAIADLPARKKQVNHHTVLEVTEHGKSRRIELSGDKAQVMLEISDIDKLAGNNKQAKKFFVLALIKANEQAIHNGQLIRDYISFPLQELIDIGFYSTPQSARKGFRDGMSILTSMKIKGHIQQTRKTTRSIEALEVLFTGAKIENNQCFLRLNYAIDWGFIVQYFTILPRYYFTLSNRASDLIYYIFYLARQHTQDIAKWGYFNIGFRAIQQRLRLPNEVGCPNPARDIKQAIEDAIEEIEREHRSTCQNMDLSLLPRYQEDASIADYLDNGYLRVSLRGDFAKTFLQISKETAKQIEKAQKRQEKITDQARATNLSKRLTQAERENKKSKKQKS